MAHRLYGIRHHGPGCARSLLAALESYTPDCLLVEGPPDAEPALRSLSDEGLRPPVALLVYSVEEPRRASFYPFALFSPEWQALRYGSRRQIPTRFIDLPCANRLALDKALESNASDDETGARDLEAEETENEEVVQDDEALREDPIGLLAESAGFEDREQWWDMQVEQRRDATGLFEAIAEAMTHLRPDLERTSELEKKREAHMRTALRAAEKEGFQRIAVVCGAWHVPALADLGNAKVDAQRLKGLPKEKVASTWIPWTYSRLSFRSGYGAGVESPGWYAHVWHHDQRAATVWAVRAGRLLRAGELEASSASVIETVRLAETLAVLRELPAPGLNELREAILGVLCAGDTLRLSVIRERLEIGEELGTVPEDVGSVPVQRDFEREAKRLRLKLTLEPLQLELDLRNENDRDRSRFLHRTRILGLDWGERVASGRSAGTFRESWRLAWRPELIVELVSANLYGNTVAAAARARLRERTEKADVRELASMIELSLIADLSEVLSDLLAALDARAADSSDVRLVMDATEPLANVIRYGDVRGTNTDGVLPVFAALIERALVGLLPAASQLDDDSAASLLASTDRAFAACMLLDQVDLKADFLAGLRALSDSEPAHPRLRGRACRLLLEQQQLSSAELSLRTHASLSAAVAPDVAARWLEGLVAGEGLFLVHHAELLGTLDAWLATLDREVFQAQLPLLRRSFSGFAAAERRALAQKLRSVGRPDSAQLANAADLDDERAARVLPVFAAVLGVSLA